MKIEVGKEYMTRGGHETKIVKIIDGIATKSCGGKVWADTGMAFTNRTHSGDIVRELPATKSPFREVRRREFIDGTYAKMAISKYDETRFRVGTSVYMNAAELREAAHLLNQLAEFLENDG